MIRMSYHALLFCPDEKAARLVTQVLSELEFEVEPCSEPFTAVKKLMAQHYDALVVDCENEQNASLLFKSARNSGSNQNSLAVAVVEGQTGVAKAFRIGANLVLTKPINIEQSKGTLRVARGLLRKADGTKAAGAIAAQEKPTSVAAPTSSAFKPTAATSAQLTPAVSLPTSLPAISKPVFQAQQPAIQPSMAASAESSSGFELEADVTPKPEPTETAMLESLPELASERPSASVGKTKEYPWQPVSKSTSGPMASALRRAAEAAGKKEEAAPVMSSPVRTSMQGAGAATAPAKEKVQASAGLIESVPSIVLPKEKIADDVVSPEAPAKTNTSPETPEAVSEDGGSKKLLVVAAIIVIAAGAGYFGWTKMHSSVDSSSTQRQVAPAPVPAPPAVTASVPATAPSGVPESTPDASNPTHTSTSMVQPSATDSSAASVSGSQGLKVPKSGAKSSQTLPSAEAQDDAGENSSEASKKITISNAPVHKALAVAPSPQAEKAEAVQPPSIQVASNHGDAALAGIVGASTTRMPAPSASGLMNVSQGVTQGLLMKKVSPNYPQQALQMRIQGPVQLQATISNDGKISNVKTLNGDPILARAASDAVKQWKYKPYTLNGEPVQIQTEITVIFKLPGQ